MRPKVAPVAEPACPVRVEFHVTFRRGPRGRRRAAAKLEPTPPAQEKPAIDPASVPKLARQLVLGYHFERLVREGKVKHYAEIARMTGLTRARVTQITNLLLLEPAIQDRILLQGGTHDTERFVRRFPSQPTWTGHIALLRIP